MFSLIYDLPDCLFLVVFALTIRMIFNTVIILLYKPIIQEVLELNTITEANNGEDETEISDLEKEIMVRLPKAFLKIKWIYGKKKKEKIILKEKI